MRGSRDAAYVAAWEASWHRAGTLGVLGLLMMIAQVAASDASSDDVKSAVAGALGDAVAGSDSVRPDERRGGLAVFTLVRGGSSASSSALDAYETFVSSRRCLRDAMPPVLQYDNVAFHEGNVALGVQRALQHRV